MKVVIISGFLGSGKSTVLQHLIKDAHVQHLRVAVIMNEFGQYNLDQYLIDQNVPQKEVIDGCICCEREADLAAQLHRLYIDVSPDIVFVECSGVAHPSGVVLACLTPILAPLVEVVGPIGVIDAVHYAQSEKTTTDVQQLVTAQLRACPLIVLNKTDCVSITEAQRMTSELIASYPEADIHITTYGRIDWSTVCLAQYDLDVPLHEHLHDGHHHGRIEHRTCRLEQPIRMEQLAAWLRRLPGHVYRVKGFVYLPDDQRVYLVQWASGILDVMPMKLN